MDKAHMDLISLQGREGLMHHHSFSKKVDENISKRGGGSLLNKAPF
jgi:hypothetical protein